MKLWDAVCTTDPETTKRVSQRGGFTAICAQSQIMAATKQWGPMGTGWGVDWELLDSPADLCLLRVTLWYGDKDRSVSHAGAAPWAAKNGTDSDALKKAITDGTTKCLSLLGFNADVFLGKFDDNKYVEGLKRGACAPSIPETRVNQIIALAKESGLQESQLIAKVEEWNLKSLAELNANQATIMEKNIREHGAANMKEGS